MKAIFTKVIPATDNKPTRIKAWADCGSITVSRHSRDTIELDGVKLFAAVALKLAAKYNWSGTLIAGGAPSNDIAEVFVFADSDRFEIPA